MSHEGIRVIKRILLFFIIITGIFLILMSPFFSIKEVTVKGNEKFTSKEIQDLAGAGYGANIFKFSYSNSEKKLLENTYIKYAAVEVKLPDGLLIEIVERKTCGYVPFMGAYLYIDQDGYVLESSIEEAEGCPKVTGLSFQEYMVGKQLSVENANSFDVVMTLSKLFLTYNYLESVAEVNLANPEDIHFYVDNIDVSFGGVAEADKKMRTVIEIIKTIPKGDKGVLHIEDAKNTPYFSYTI